VLIQFELRQRDKLMKKPITAPIHATENKAKPSQVNPKKKNKNPTNANGNVNSHSRIPRNRGSLNTLANSNFVMFMITCTQA
jgi:hypothetical protein